jgi:hypothetical protein
MSFKSLPRDEVSGAAVSLMAAISDMRLLSAELLRVRKRWVSLMRSPDMVVWQIAGGVVALGAAAFVADRVLLWMERRGWVYWRKRKGLMSIGVDFLQEGDPAARAAAHAMEQERVRKNVRPAEEPPLHVDLDAGVVRIRREHDGHEQ